LFQLDVEIFVVLDCEILSNGQTVYQRQGGNERTVEVKTMARRNCQLTMRNVLCQSALGDTDRGSAQLCISRNAITIQFAKTQPFDGSNAAACGQNLVACFQCLYVDFTVRRCNMCAFEVTRVSHCAALEKYLVRIQPLCIKAANSNSKIVFKDQIAIDVFATCSIGYL